MVESEVKDMERTPCDERNVTTMYRQERAVECMIMVVKWSKSWFADSESHHEQFGRFGGERLGKNTT